MRLVTGDECGILKECLPDAVPKKRHDGSEPLISTDKGIQHISAAATNSGGRRQGVIHMTWLKASQFASLHVDGSVQVWERTVNEPRKFGKYRRTANFSNVFAPTSSGDDNEPISPRIRPLSLDRLVLGDQERIVTCNAAGTVVILDPGNRTTTPVVSRFEAIQSKAADDPIVSAVAIHADKQWIALGGKDRETVLVDLESTKQFWKAKNLPPDPQTLLQPLVWPTTIQFLHAPTLGDNVMAVGTALHQVRLYDIRDTQRRPVAYTPDSLLEHRVTALCQVDPFQLCIGDASGQILSVDIRVLGKGTGKVNAERFVGPAGSIRQMAKHATLPRMAVVGLDRFLRIYDTKSREQLYSLYMKQRLNCVLFSPDGVDGDEDTAAASDSDIDQDDVVQDYIDSDDESESSQSSSGFDRSNHESCSSPERGAVDDVAGDGASDDHERHAHARNAAEDLEPSRANALSRKRQKQ